MLQRLGIIADDLTGANDTGVQCACHGYRTTVYLDDISHYNYADVLVLNTDSRQDPAQQAGRKAFEAANELLNAGVGRIYKKIDSVMRGNIGAELDQVCSVHLSRISSAGANRGQWRGAHQWSAHPRLRHHPRPYHTRKERLHLRYHSSAKSASDDSSYPCPSAGSAVAKQACILCRTGLLCGNGCGNRGGHEGHWQHSF